MKLPCFLALFALAPLGCTATEDSCPPIGCIENVTVDLQTADGKRFAEGTYTITVTADGVRTVVTCAVPAASTSAVSCGAKDKVDVSSDAAHLLVRLLGTPKTVTLTLEAAGKRLAETSFAPSYTGVAVGPEANCPVCQGASSTVTVAGT